MCSLPFQEQRRQPSSPRSRRCPNSPRRQKTVKAPDAKYQGDPEFEPYRENFDAIRREHDKQIIKLGDLYLCEFQAVWFMSKTPNGRSSPWNYEEVPKDLYHSDWNPRFTT